MYNLSVSKSREKSRQAIDSVHELRDSTTIQASNDLKNGIRLSNINANNANMSYSNSGRALLMMNPRRQVFSTHQNRDLVSLNEKEVDYLL